MHDQPVPIAANVEYQPVVAHKIDCGTELALRSEQSLDLPILPQVDRFGGRRAR